MKILTKIILTIIYPFWVFFAKTWLGNVIMIPVSLSVLPILIFLIFPELNDVTETEEKQGIGVGIGILSILLSPFSAMLFLIISGLLKTSFENINYKTDFNFNY